MSIGVYAKRINRVYQLSDRYLSSWLYNGDAARLIPSIESITLGAQPACLNASLTGLIDCGNWPVSASCMVPAQAVSGVYLAPLVRKDIGGDVANHIALIVRHDAGDYDRDANLGYIASL